MGSYSTLYVDGKEIFSRKHEPDQVLMTLIQASERLIRCGSIEEIAPSLLEDDPENASEQIELLTYEITVNALKRQTKGSGIFSDYSS